MTYRAPVADIAFALSMHRFGPALAAGLYGDSHRGLVERSGGGRRFASDVLAAAQRDRRPPRTPLRDGASPRRRAGGRLSGLGGRRLERLAAPAQWAAGAAAGLNAACLEM